VQAKTLQWRSGHLLGALVPVVELVGGAVGVPALSQDEDVGGATEGILLVMRISKRPKRDVSHFQAMDGYDIQRR